MTGKTSRNTYDESTINWARLHAYAKKVARETTQPRGTKQVRKRETKTREVRYGFLNLKSRMENYTVETTQTVTRDHWVLAHRYWHKKEHWDSTYADENTYETMEYCLDVNGTLFVQHTSMTEILPKFGGCITEWGTPSKRPFREEDVILFDFEAKYYNKRQGRVSIETDREPDRRRRRYHIKGVGLTKALKNLLPASPSDYSHLR